MKMPLFRKAIDALLSRGRDGARPSRGSAGRLALPAMIAAVALGAANPARASNFTVTSSTSGSSARFIVTRDDTTAAETVNYRTVSISAYAGQHYTAKSGTLTFPVGQSAITNTVTEQTPSQAAYKFQTGASRYYRFEITDAGGFLVTNATRSLTTGTRVTASDAFGVKTDARTNVATEKGAHRTNVDRVFTAGDMHIGQSLVVRAIREGVDCAREVDADLMGYSNL